MRKFTPVQIKIFSNRYAAVAEREFNEWAAAHSNHYIDSVKPLCTNGSFYLVVVFEDWSGVVEPDV